MVQKHNAANVLTIQVQNLTQQTQETTQEIAILTQQVTTLTQEKQGLLQQVATLTQEKEEAIRYFTALLEDPANAPSLITNRIELTTEIEKASLICEKITGMDVPINTSLKDILDLMASALTTQQS